MDTTPQPRNQRHRYHDLLPSAIKMFTSCLTRRRLRFLRRVRISKIGLNTTCLTMSLSPMLPPPASWRNIDAGLGSALTSTWLRSHHLHGTTVWHQRAPLWATRYLTVHNHVDRTADVVTWMSSYLSAKLPLLRIWQGRVGTLILSACG